MRLKKPKSLTSREWYCIQVAAHFTAGNRWATQPLLRRAIVTERLPERMFSELFLQLSLLLGFPTMLEGFSILRTVSDKSQKGPEHSFVEGKAENEGRKVLKRVYGSAVDRLLVNLKTMHDVVPSVIVRDVYGRILSRPGLSLRERELINVAVLSIQGLEQQLYSHIRGALRMQAEIKAIRSAIVLAARIAASDPAKSLRLLLSIAQSKNGRS